MINRANRQTLSIYIHIPYCVRKCLYCDFLSVQADQTSAAAYTEALQKEMALAAEAYAGYTVETVFIGGGTPTAVDCAHIEAMMHTLRTHYTLAAHPEITIEANPGTVDRQKLVRYKAAGINRISIGLQSLHDHELALLGRIHSAAEFYEAFDLAREAGFDNINVDLMEALPGQREEDLRFTLEGVVALAPEHISAYSLIVEEETPFYAMVRDHKLPDLPSEEEDRSMDQLTERVLAQSGYHRYEISNYAKEGKECRHNLVYWERGSYLGLGVGAASMTDNMRWSNTRDMGAYISGMEQEERMEQSALRQELQVLTQKEQMEEFMFLGLRLTEGVSKEKFIQTFQVSVCEVYGALLQKLIREGLLEDDGNLKLTPYGRDISNYVMAQFII